MDGRGSHGLLERVLAGERRAIAQAISVFENGAPGADALAAGIAPHRGRAHVVGITGVPGAGKSTLIDGLLGEWIAAGARVAVVAVDPSSPVSGGAVLGDRVRMGAHASHERVFIRSVSSRGHLGGLSRTTARFVDVLDAAGFDVVLVETVGTGQSEIEITTLADTRVVVCPPGLGDEVQTLKAGILEIADVLVVSKADLPGAEAILRDLRDMLRLRSRGAREPAIVTTSATPRAGFAELLAAIARHGTTAGRGTRLRAEEPQPAPAPDEAAARVARLAERADFARHIGVRCLDAGAGRAVVQLTVDPTHLNFNGTCHGGVLFTVADAAFGLASNSHGNLAAGIDAHMTYHQAARVGDVLTATATEISRGRRLAVYRVELTRDATLLGSFTGTVYIASRRNESPPS